MSSMPAIASLYSGLHYIERRVGEVDLSGDSFSARRVNILPRVSLARFYG
jgi:hypothetical protein